MNRDLLRGWGCLTALVVAMPLLLGAIWIAALVAGGIGAATVGPPLAIVLFLSLVVGGGYAILEAARYVGRAFQRGWDRSPYAGKIEEIDRLLAEVRNRIDAVTGADYSAPLNAKLRVLKERATEIHAGLLELDRELADRDNRSGRFAIREALLRARAFVATGEVKEGFERNLQALHEVGAALRHVRERRAALLASLDRVSLGLREVRLLLVPAALPADAPAEIGRELQSLTEALAVDERARREAEAAGAPTAPAAAEGARTAPPKQTV